MNQSFIREYMENLTNSTYDYLIAHNLSNIIFMKMIIRDMALIHAEYSFWVIL